MDKEEMLKKYVSMKEIGVSIPDCECGECRVCKMVAFVEKARGVNRAEAIKIVWEAISPMDCICMEHNEEDRAQENGS